MSTSSQVPRRRRTPTSLRLLRRGRTRNPWRRRRSPRIPASPRPALRRRTPRRRMIRCPRRSRCGTSRLATAFPYSVLAPQVWPTATGRGIGVAVIDTESTGACRTSRTPPARRASSPRVATNPDATRPGRRLRPRHPRGRASSPATAAAAARRPVGRQYVGIAPDANLIAIKASDDDGRRDHPRRHLRPAVRRRPQGRLQHPRRQPLAVVDGRPVISDRPARCRRRVGVLPRNPRRRRRRQPRRRRGRLAYAPGNDPFALSVGAVDDQGTAERVDDAFADWSSAGPTQDGFASPRSPRPARISSRRWPAAAPSRTLPGVHRRRRATSAWAGRRWRRRSWLVSRRCCSRRIRTGRPTRSKSTLIETARNVTGGVDEVNATPPSRPRRRLPA